MTSFALLLLPLLLQGQHLFTAAFLSSSPLPIINNGIRSPTCNSQQQLLSKSSTALFAVDEGPQEIAVTINTTLTDDKIKNLFAWVKCAFDDGGGDKDDVYAYYYNNIELAIAAVFGDNLPSDSLPTKLLEMALKKEGLLEQYQQKEAIVEDEEWEEACVGDVIGRRDREQASLGAMGAAQWSGQWMTRPHSLLLVQNYTSVDDWIKPLKRKRRETLKRAGREAQNFTVITKPIRGGHPAPHSSYAHFRCVVQHEVRLLSKMYGASTNAFVNALAEAISRYIGTTRMAGVIQEYRDVSTNKVIGFAHEVSKGRTTRGQWFYCDDYAAKHYVWFHSVLDLVRRAIEDDRIDVVDLGPSGSDAFTDLKAQYGFEAVVDWPAVADYSGDFLYEENQNEDELGDDMIRMIEKLVERQAARDKRRKSDE
ncbi:hypothetical protein QTG54_004017 [Skeletonema marinoi]|uniref:Uncharacterized protein n=1 Tax=Skeletonema marinoi TaxID=267567 RepID=A0AAD8YDX3_9STRA|nr:hypothetical protein QTG54_004017 [Skeletonema marinoi]